MTILTRNTDVKTALFTYHYADARRVTDAVTLQWIVDLKIPPAWRNVTINYGTSHAQTACGRDEKGRMQCLYSSTHKTRAKREKYCALIEFGEQLPRIMADIKAALQSARYTKAKLIAIVLRIVMSCGFRLGTLKYEAENESYGITTVRREHVRFDASGAHFAFTGKKGVHNECLVTDAEVVACLQHLASVKKTDDHLMQYQLAGEWLHLKHTDVNVWLRDRGETFTSKNFRTWTANVMIIDMLHDKPPAAAVTARKKIMNAEIKTVSVAIHNTPAVCRSQYIDPEILDMYMEHPVRYRKLFITPATPARNMFLNYLKVKCA